MIMREGGEMAGSADKNKIMVPQTKCQKRLTNRGKREKERERERKRVVFLPFLTYYLRMREKNI